MGALWYVAVAREGCQVPMKLLVCICPFGLDAAARTLDVFSLSWSAVLSIIWHEVHVT